jgi:hypothetical protein
MRFEKIQFLSLPLGTRFRFNPNESEPVYVCLDRVMGEYVQWRGYSAWLADDSAEKKSLHVSDAITINVYVDPDLES